MNRKGNKHKENRRKAMIEALKANGPMTIQALAQILDWGQESIRVELMLNLGVLFEQVQEQERGQMNGSKPRLFYLTAEALGVSEEEYERMSDSMFRDDGSWFPKADSLLLQTINAMVRMRVASNSEAA
jgi:predicted ArsR family transcriptional regulator